MKAGVSPHSMPFVAVVIGREVKHVTFETPDGPLEGYQLRFQLGTPQPGGPAVESWTDWIHLPNPLMLYLTESLDEFMRTEGHLQAAKGVDGPAA